MADNIQQVKALHDILSANVLLKGIAVLLVVFPIAEIIVGAVYVHDCPVAPILPAYLIVLGIFCLLLVGLFVMIQPFPAVGDHWIWNGAVTVASLFTLGWFFYGTYVVYTMFPIYYDLINRPPRSEGSYFTPIVSENTLNAIDPLSSNSTHFTTEAPEYTESTSFNIRFSPSTPSSMLNPSDQNQTQSPSFSQTTMSTNRNQTLMNLIQTLALSSTQMHEKHLNTPQTGAVRSDAFYCDPNLYLFVFCTTTLIYVSIAISCAISSARKKCCK